MRIYFLPVKTIKMVALVFSLVVVLVLGFFIYRTLASLSTYPISAPHYQGSTGEKKVSFTFNVDWGEEYLPSLLKVLKEGEIKGTFFITGKWARAHPELVKEIAGNGHEIGNHGGRHLHVKDLSLEGVKKEIQEGEDILKEITGTKPRLYAPAFGEYDRKIGEAAKSLGYEVIMWSLDTIDWQNPDVNTIVRRVVPRIHDDAIILMHPTRPTVEALPTIIKQLKKENYQFATVSTLIKSQ